MRRFTLRVLRVFAQFLVAGGFTRAINAWVIPLDPAWQLTVLAITQLLIAVAQAMLQPQRPVRRRLVTPRPSIRPVSNADDQHSTPGIRWRGH